MYRDLVLECAERVFAREGFHTAKMQDIAAEAGISLNTLYAVFPGKREIFQEVHESRGRAFFARVEAALAPAPPAREAIARGVRAFVEFLLDHADYFRMDLREGRSWAVGDVEASPAFQAGIRLWTELMRRGIAEGVFYDEDPGLMATTAFGLMQMQLAYLLAHDGEPDRGRIADRITLQLERAFCQPEPAAAPRRADWRESESPEPQRGGGPDGPG
jgi:AcrR family transcriptional regulator